MLLIGPQLTLDSKRYAEVWPNVHENPEVRFAHDPHPRDAFKSATKDLNKIQDLLHPISVGPSNFTYLEFSATEIELYGRKWKVFGSPVCTIISY
jgi:hypothetical protein